MLGRGRRVPMDALREAMDIFVDVDPVIQQAAANQNGRVDFDENRFAEALVSGDIATTFGAVTDVLQDGASIDQIATTMVLLAADRMARTPVGMSPGWGDLSWEMSLASSLRTIERHAGFATAARACYHAAWQFFDDRWLNISTRDLTEPGGKESEAAADSAAEDSALEAILEAIESIRIRDIGRMTRDYLHGGHSGDRLMAELGLTILKDDNGWNLLHTLRTVCDEWGHCATHPARNQLLVGLARWATDARRSIGSQSAAQTAQRFARGETAVELYYE